MRSTSISLCVAALFLAFALVGCSDDQGVQTVVVPRDTDAPTSEEQSAPAEEVPVSPTVTLRPVDPPATSEPAAPTTEPTAAVAPTEPLVEPSPTATLPPPSPTTKPKPTATKKPPPPTKPPAPQLPACCQPAGSGQGWLWFENHVGEVVAADVGPNYYEIPAKQGDVAGCLCLPLNPGTHTVILHTGSHEGRFEVDIVAGRVIRVPVSYQN